MTISDFLLLADVLQNISEWIAKVISLVKCFVRSGKPVAAICHAAQVLTAADVVCGRKLTCYPALAAEVKLAGGNYIEVAPDEAVVDCNLILHQHGQEIQQF